MRLQQGERCFFHVTLAVGRWCVTVIEAALSGTRPVIKPGEIWTPSR